MNIIELGETCYFAYLKHFKKKKKIKKWYEIVKSQKFNYSLILLLRIF